MPKPVRTYVGLVVVAGALVLSASAIQWRSDHLLQFGFYLLFVVLASQLKVALPGVTGTLSINFVLILMAVASLNLPQALLVALAGSLAQCLWRTKSRPKPLQVVFNLSTVILSSAAAYCVYQSAALRQFNSHPALMLLWASMMYFLTNTCAVAQIIAFTESKSSLAVWRGSFLWTGPQYIFGGFVAWLANLVTTHFGWEVSTLVLPVVLMVDYSYRLYLGRLEQEQAHVKEMADLHLRTIQSLALAIEAKDETTNNHLKRVQIYATEIARDLGVSEDELRAVQAAAVLHDIGKLAVPEYIISKPGPLTAEEFERMKIHPVVGAEILGTVGFPYPVVPIVRHHHERWNGTGYPDGLKGEQIPIGARILAAVDCLDSLASDRQYRRAVPLEQAMSIVEAESGKSFDPKVVEVLQRLYVALEQKAKAAPAVNGRLSKHVRIERGAAPAAGLQAEASSQTPDNSVDFVQSIASARQEIQTLLELTHGLGNSLSTRDTFLLLASRLKDAIPHDGVAVYIRQGDALTPEYVAGADSKLFGSLRIPLGQGLSGWVVENQKPILNGNPSVEPGYLDDPRKFSTLRSALSVPLPGQNGAIGCLTLYHHDADAFSRDHLRLLMAISSKCGMALENALEYKLALQSAATDELTGLPNARALCLTLDRELSLAKATQAPLAVLVLDIDSFKRVNDQFGHLEGNRLLKLIASGLNKLCRDSDYVARMGGDEFVMILRNVVPAAADQRIALLREMVSQQGRAVTGAAWVSLSVGAAFCPDDGASAESLLAAADQRMYAMKQTRQIPMESAGIPELATLGNRLEA